MCVRTSWSLTALSIAFMGGLFGCEQKPTVGGRALLVTAPVTGRVIVESEVQFIDSETPVVFDQVPAGSVDVTLVSDEFRVTLLSVLNDKVNFTGFVSNDAQVRGTLTPISLRADPTEDVDIVVISNGQRFHLSDGLDSKIVEVPQGHEVIAIALWRGDGQIRWTVRSLGLPSELEGHESILKPTVQANSSTVVHLEQGPPGWMTAELVYRGIRTGLKVGQGRVGVATGAIIATSTQVDDDLSLWVHVQAEGLGPNRSQHDIGASIPMGRPSLALAWVDQPFVSPAPQQMEDALPIGSSSFAWSVDDSETGPVILDVELEALGVCREVNWRMIGPMSGDVELPEVDTESVLSAPLIRAQVRTVDMEGQTWLTWVSQFIPEASLPLFTGLSRSSSSFGYWRRQRRCDNHPYQGRYAAYPLDHPNCAVDGTTDVYLIDRCGAVIRVDSGPVELKELCGEITENLFSPIQGVELGIQELDNGTLRVGTGFTAVDLVPLNEDGTAVEQAWRNHWYRYDTTEQDFLLSGDGLETAQNDPVRIAVGGADGGPWLHVGADGRGTSRARFAQFDFILRGDEPSRTLHVEAHGCQGKPRRMSAFMEDGSLVFQEKIFADRDDEFRLRTYRFQR